MMLDHPAPGRHLPAGVELRHGSKPGQESVDQGQTGENPENTALQRRIFPVGGLVAVGVTALEYSESSADGEMHVETRGR